MSLISSNTAGATKKSFGSVTIAISYGIVNPLLPSLVLQLQAGLTHSWHLQTAVGNMIGPQFFLDSQKPHYSLGIGAMIFSFVMMAFCGVLYWFVFV